MLCLGLPRRKRLNSVGGLKRDASEDDRGEKEGREDHYSWSPHRGEFEKFRGTNTSLSAVVTA